MPIQYEIISKHAIFTHLVEDLGDAETLCGRSKGNISKWEQWITVSSLDKPDFEQFDWCQVCSEHPAFQLLLLAFTDL